MVGHEHESSSEDDTQSVNLNHQLEKKGLGALDNDSLNSSQMRGLSDMFKGNNIYDRS